MRRTNLSFDQNGDEVKPLTTNEIKPLSEDERRTLSHKNFVFEDDKSRFFIVRTVRLCYFKDMGQKK